MTLRQHHKQGCFDAFGLLVITRRCMIQPSGKAGGMGSEVLAGCRRHIGNAIVVYQPIIGAVRAERLRGEVIHAVLKTNKIAALLTDNR